LATGCLTASGVAAGCLALCAMALPHTAEALQSMRNPVGNCCPTALQRVQFDGSLRESSDDATGARLAIPVNLVGAPRRTKLGTNWQAANGRLSIDTLEFREGSLEALYARLRKRQGRTVTRGELAADGFVLEGTDRDGSSFRIIARNKEGTTHALSVVFTAGDRDVAEVVPRIIASYQPFPMVEAVPVPPPVPPPAPLPAPAGRVAPVIRQTEAAPIVKAREDATALENAFRRLPDEERREWEDCKSAEPAASIEHCSRLIAKDNAPPLVLAVAYNNRAAAHKKGGNLIRALSDYNQAIKLNPNYAHAYYNRGLTYEASEASERALQDYDTAIRLDPAYAKAYARRGMFLLEKDDIDAAVPDLGQALTLEPELDFGKGARIVEKLEEAANDALAAGDNERAIAVATVVIQLGKSQKVDPLLVRAIAHSRSGNLEAAISDYSKALELAPGNAVLLANRCWAYTQKGDLAQAARDCDEAVSAAGPQQWYSLQMRGQLHMRRANFVEAEKNFSEALRLVPDAIVALVSRAEAYEKLGQRERAVADYRKAAAMTPRNDSGIDAAAKERAVEHLKALNR
jgi:tetratricopeptide (TPR) repeat protein